ncbi:hypothetical protein [Telluribacter sp.]|jgi:hypothetical protein|uniref:hypothetical protein n=1 Tax=Telluribacter sp. TaxID=1978767 RepID=UPI002E13D2CC|nr:hypothetical protein [Telluribacter sp.]
MKSSELNKFLYTGLGGDDFKALIENEAASYGQLMEKVGLRISLIFDEDEELLLNDTSIKKLLQETLSGSLSNVDLAYICDCLTLGERVDYESEEAKNIIFEIADPEINGGYKSDEELKSMINALTTE